MARVTRIVDDLDPAVELTEEEAKTVRFSINEKRYKLETSEKNEAAFMKALAKFIDAAQEEAFTATRSAASAAAGPSSARQKFLADVRVWAGANGHDVKDRGRIAQNVIEAYIAETGETEPE